MLPFLYDLRVFHKRVLTDTVPLGYTKEIIALNLKFLLKIEVLTSLSELTPVSSGTEDLYYRPGQGAGRLD